jgi:hypothetical protein
MPPAIGTSVNIPVHPAPRLVTRGQVLSLALKTSTRVKTIRTREPRAWQKSPITTLSRKPHSLDACDASFVLHPAAASPVSPLLATDNRPDGLAQLQPQHETLIEGLVSQTWDNMVLRSKFDSSLQHQDALQPM